MLKKLFKIGGKMVKLYLALTVIAWALIGIIKSMTKSLKKKGCLDMNYTFDDTYDDILYLKENYKKKWKWF